MYIGMTKTAYRTQRIYVRARDVELEKLYDRFQTFKKFLDLVCCWGGADKSDRDRDGEGGFISWEISEEDAYSVYNALPVMLRRMGVSFEEDILKATDCS
jgi:hypothetical protein